MPEPVTFANWEPDKSDRANPASEAKGVLSVAGQYAPWKDLADYNADLAATVAICQGGGIFYDSVNAPHIYLGDASKLYHLESKIAVDRSLLGGYALSGGDDWDFAQFGDFTVAVAGTEAPQVHDMTPGSTAFANLGGSPPTDATSVARVGDFLMMGKKNVLHWSAFNNHADWVPDVGTQAGNQDLDQEKGDIKKIIGLDYAAIFQERGIRRANYVGPPIIWDFGQDYVEKERGCISRHAAAAWGRIIYYVSDDGFYAFDGQASIPIGYGKVDDYFARNLNYSFRHKIRVSCVDKIFYVGFPSGSSANISEILAYSIPDQRWTRDVEDLDVLLASPAEAITVETTHLIFTGDNLDDAVTPDNIDIPLSDPRRQLAAVRSLNHRLGFFAGANRAATIETSEFEIKPGQRSLVTELWPMGDFQQGAVNCSLGYRRALPGALVTYTNPTAMNRVGFCPQRIDARFLRGRTDIGAGAVWRRAEGLGYTAVMTGGR
jgi:hypothetical protein